VCEKETGKLFKYLVMTLQNVVTGSTCYKARTCSCGFRM